MANTPKQLVSALDMIIDRALPGDAAAPEIVTRHHQRACRAFDDPNIVGDQTFL